MKKVLVSGCFDMLHSGHVAFFEEAARYGELYVAIGSDKTVEELKNRKTVCPQDERLYMVEAIRFVKKAYVSSGSGMLDFVEVMDEVKPDIFFVNEDGNREDKKEICAKRGIEYIVRPRLPHGALPWRSTTSLRKLTGNERLTSK